MNFRVSISLLLAAVFIIGCAGKPEALPEWVTELNRDPAYWYGLGIGVSRDDARNRAINEIGSQISVSISSSMSGIKTEHNFNVNEYTRQVIRARIDQNLDNIELVDSYQIDGQYYILARLSRTKYYQTLEKQKTQAVQTALQKINQAASEFGVNSFILLFEAKKQIEPFRDMDLNVELPGQTGDKQDLWSYIRLTVMNTIDRIQCSTENDEFSVKFGIPLTQMIRVECDDNVTGEPLQGLPLLMEFGYNSYISTVTTNRNGSAEFIVSGITDKEKIQSAVISPLLTSILPESDDWFQNTDKLRFTFHISGLKIFFSGEEFNLDRPVASPIVLPVVKKQLVERFMAEFVGNGEADMLVRAEVTTEKRSDTPEKISGLRVYQTIAAGTFTFVDLENQREIYQTSLTGVKGVSYTSFEDAGYDALKKLKKRLLKEDILNIYGK